MTIARLSRTALALPFVVALPITLASCADKDDNAPVFTVTANDDTCDLDGYDATTGNNSFEVSNSGKKITEFYVYSEGGRVIGEIENIGPGASRKLLVSIPESGTYKVTCKPGMVGEGISHDLSVTGNAVDLTEGDDKLTAAVEGYLRYVRSQTSALQETTDTFVQAIENGDVEQAKALFAVTRTYYERIEPIAESFPDDLDPRIDLREADVEEGQQWTGYHRLEKQLWVDGTITATTKTIAAQLAKDIQELVDGVNSSDFTVAPDQISNGAHTLLDEISTKKITGEEDIFSHTDLWDFQANLDGAKAAIAALEESIDDKDSDLLSAINTKFEAVQKLLDRLRKGDGFVSYDTVSEPQRKELSTALDQLNEKVALVTGVITAAGAK